MPTLRSQKQSQAVEQETEQTKAEVKMAMNKPDNISQWVMLGPGVFLNYYF